jgi:ubiquinone/menaquinone biosynthesis C-methylase UbiE
MTTRSFARQLFALLFVTLLVPMAGRAQPAGSRIDDQTVLDALGLREGMIACEIGAGDGELTIAAARIVGASGRVYSSELGESRVANLRKHVEDSGLAQITVVAGDPNKTNFPDGACDAVFMRNVYHHFDDPAAMDASISTALKPGGRVAIVDFNPRGGEADRPEGRDAENHHGVSPESVLRELKAAGFQPASSTADNDRGFMVVVSKPRR